MHAILWCFKKSQTHFYEVNSVVRDFDENDFTHTIVFAKHWLCTKTKSCFVIKCQWNYQKCINCHLKQPWSFSLIKNETCISYLYNCHDQLKRSTITQFTLNSNHSLIRSIVTREYSYKTYLFDHDHRTILGYPVVLL